ncbi:quinon protein alcohol dehydrogenase-like superfamily [Xylariales sp. PMI_506]|nr:quinon protein alcohol dehydrogenase-like superfamily [Xylariales sp. PMI_506]
MLEVLPLLGKVSDGAVTIKQLLNICQCPNAPAELSDFIKDANKIVASFGSMIEQTPLQIYGALMLFFPLTSKVRNKFWEQRLPGLPHVYGVNSDWDALRQTFEGHFEFVKVVAFSPDDQVVALASKNTVWLWDVATGAHRQTLKGHNGQVTAVAFSPNGQVVASASSYDKTVQVWDAATCAHRQTIDVVCTKNLIFGLFSNTRLFIDSRAVDLPAGSLVGKLHPRREVALLPAICGLGLSPDRTWIVEGKEKIVWFPSEYRPTASATRESVMFIGCSSGRISLVDRGVTPPNVPNLVITLHRIDKTEKHNGNSQEQAWDRPSIYTDQHSQSSIDVTEPRPIGWCRRAGCASNGDEQEQARRRPAFHAE